MPSRGAGLRSLGTRRPFTPRDAQRTLFGERARPDRPPSALNMRHLRLEATGASFDEGTLQTLLISERPANTPANHKMAQRRSKSFHIEDSLTLEQNHHNMKLPQLTGQSKPLHRRTLDPMRCLSEENEDTGYESTSIEQSVYSKHEQICSRGSNSADFRRNNFNNSKSKSVDSEPARMRKNTSFESNSDKGHSDTGSDFDSSESSSNIRRIAVQIPSPPSEMYNGSFDEDQQQTSNKLSKNLALSPKKIISEQESIVKNGSSSNSLVKTTSNDSISKTDEKRFIFDLLEKMTPKQGEKYQNDQIVKLLAEFHDFLDRFGLWHSIGGKVKTAILKTLYGHVESDDDRILIGIAKVLLTMRVTGSNLAAVFKLVFKVARNDKNDYLFKTGNILDLVVEGMGRACPLLEAECCVYAGGAVRFLSLDAGLRRAAQQAGAVHLLALHLKLINNAKSESPRSVSEQTSHALYQLTGALRHLAEPTLKDESPSTDPSAALTAPALFVESGALEQLCKTVDLFITDLDVLTNVTRTLSVLSASRSCCMWLGAQASACGATLRALAAAAGRPALVVRLAYALGNIAACSDEGRLNVFRTTSSDRNLTKAVPIHQNILCMDWYETPATTPSRNTRPCHSQAFLIYSEPGSIECLLTVMEIYLELCTKDPLFNTNDSEEDAERHLIGSDLAGSSGSNEDVLVKTIRVLANICMNSSAGLALARSDSAARACQCLLGVARLQPDAARPTTAVGDHELPVAALAAINNLSYYHDGEGPFDDVMWELCEVSCQHLSRGGAAGAEAVRALGNLSRSHRARDQLLRDHTYVHAVAAYLHDGDSEVRHAAAGVVVNVCGGEGGDEGGGWLRQSAGVGVSAWSGAACGALAAAARLRDYSLAALLSRALWNAALLGALDTSRARGAVELLDQMIDDEQIFADHLSEDDDLGYENLESDEEKHSTSSFAAWEDFAAVAIALLEHLSPAIEQHFCDNVHNIHEVCISTDSRDLVQI